MAISQAAEYFSLIIQNLALTLIFTNSLTAQNIQVKLLVGLPLKAVYKTQSAKNGSHSLEKIIPMYISHIKSSIFNSFNLSFNSHLEKFCVIGRASNGSLTSYLFDINGNIIDKSSAINLVSNFDIATNSYDVSICWSDTENKFVAVSYQGTNSGVVAYSSDGLNWNSTKISGLVSGYPLGPVSWNEKFNAFVLAAKNYIYTSPDGITWTRIKTFSDFTIYEMAWSESKQTLCIAGTNYVSYITKDLAEWEKLSMPAAINPSGKTIWSNTVNGFIATPAFTNKGFLRLKI